MNQIAELVDYLNEKDNLYLYGAGNIAKLLTTCLERKKIVVQGYVVTKKEKTQIEYNGKKIWSLEELKESDVDLSIWNVVVAIKGRCLDIKSICANIGFGSIIFLSEKLIEELQHWEMEHVFDGNHNQYQFYMVYPMQEKNMAIVTDKQKGLPIFRVFEYTHVRQKDILLEHCTIETYENQFGPLHILPNRTPGRILSDHDLTGDVELYVATSHLDHVEAEQFKKEGLRPIQVGAALTSVRKGCQTDDIGDNISDRNRDFCECTGLYWIWKNTSGQDYVGLEQYRRKLKINSSSITWLKRNGVDVVLALPQFAMLKVKDFFSDRIISQYDWQLMKKFILEYDKDYQSVLENYDEAWFYFSCNLCLFKREWFDRYCEFAFAIAFKIDDFYKQKGVIRQDRYMGYIFENLLSVFMMYHYREMKVVCTEVEWIE